MPKTIPAKTIVDPTFDDMEITGLARVDDGQGGKVNRCEVAYQLRDDGGDAHGARKTLPLEGFAASITIAQLAALALTAIKAAEGFDS